jgi:hypothetical protein
VCYGQEHIRSQKIVEFLHSNWEVKTETNEWQFTGAFIALPQKLENDLLSSFPKHKFSLAEMRFVGHFPFSKYPLIVITDAQSGEVIGFIRQLNWGVTSKSFNELFGNYQAVTKEELEKRLLVLGQLIALTDQRGNIGAITRRKNSVSVDIMWGGNIWRRLEAQFDHKFHIKKMALKKASGRSFF